jgi:hypothetical protein
MFRVEVWGLLVAGYFLDLLSHPEGEDNMLLGNGEVAPPGCMASCHVQAEGQPHREHTTQAAGGQT